MCQTLPDYVQRNHLQVKFAKAMSAFVTASSLGSLVSAPPALFLLAFKTALVSANVGI